MSETEIEDLVQHYQQGTPINVLAAELGLHRTTISAQLKARGVLEPARRIDDLERAEIVRFYQQGLSLVAVAERLGISSRTVHRVLQQADVQTRPVGTNKSSTRS